MKKTKRKVIGVQRVKPFPVVNLRFRLVEPSEVCCMPECESLKLFADRQKALFKVQVCGSLSLPGNLSEKEGSEIAWEKAYREQKAGKEPEPIAYPVCAQCAAATIMKFLNDSDERRAALVISRAVTTGQDIILFDRNLSRERTYPTVTWGNFETLADFRRAYYEQKG